MKKTVRTRISEGVILTCALLLFALFLFSEWHYYRMQNPPRISVLVRTVGLLALCFELWLWASVVRDHNPDSRSMIWVLRLALLLYLYLLLSFTLFDPTLGRGIFAGYGKGRDYYLAHYVNLIPGRSIWAVYIRGFANGYVNSFYMLLNLLGNICALMPLSLLLPRIWAASRKWYVMLLCVTGSVALIELLQFWLMVGSCDIDDLILNAGGAMLLYGILKIPCLRKWIEQLL